MDETGFMLHPTVRQTWAPRGQTPIQHSWDRHDRLSVIGAITVSPIQNRLGFYFAMQAAHVTGEDLVAFVQRLHGHLKRPLRVIWDRFSGHKKAQRLLHDIYGRRIQGQYLPAYAPDLHVVDHAWSHTQYGERANFLPHDLDDLAQEVATSLLAKHQRPDLLRSFFNHAGLELGAGH